MATRTHTLRETKQLPLSTLVHGGNYDTEYFGSFVEKLGIKLDGEATSAAGAGTPVQDGAFRLLGAQLRVEQNEEPMVAMDPIDLRHLAALVDGAYPRYQADAPAVGVPTRVLASASLDFKKILPGSGINARIDKAFVRGTYGAAAVFDSGAPVLTALRLRNYVEHQPAADPAEFWRPSFTQKSVALFPAATDIQEVFRFERAQVVVGWLLRVVDASAVARVDGLLRRLKIQVTRAGLGDREPFNATWAIARQLTMQMAGFGEDEYSASTGVALLKLADPAMPTIGGATAFAAGDTCTFTLDSSTSNLDEFVPVVAAAGDLVVITKLAFDRVRGSTVVQGLTPADVGVRAVPTNGGRPARGARGMGLGGR